MLESLRTHKSLDSHFETCQLFLTLVQIMPQLKARDHSAVLPVVQNATPDRNCLSDVNCTLS